MSTAEIVTFDRANVTIVSKEAIIDTHGMNPFVAQKVKRAEKAVKSTKEATIDLVEIILEVEHDSLFHEQFAGGWRQMFSDLGISGSAQSLFWKVANVLARAVGIGALRDSTMNDLRMFHEAAMLAEDWQLKRDYPLEDASRDAITAAVGKNREQLEDLRKGRLDYDPNTRSSLGELGSADKGVTKNLKKGLDELGKSAKLVGGETGKAFHVSQDATLEMLASVLQNPANGWLRETLVEFAPTSQTPEEFIEILGKRIAISNARAKSECSDEDIAAGIKAQMPQKAILQTFRIGTGRLNRVLELVKAGKL